MSVLMIMIIVIIVNFVLGIIADMILFTLYVFL